MLARTQTLTLITTACLFWLSACDSSSNGLVSSADNNGVISGGGAGDSTGSNGSETSAAVSLLQPFTGIYETTGNWRGQIGDVAYFDIQSPGADGESSVRFYDFDELLNCLLRPPSPGIARKDVFSNRIFMDELFQFDEAELTLIGTALRIEFNDDLDLDSDGSTQDRVTLNAQRVGVAGVSDLGPDC